MSEKYKLPHLLFTDVPCMNLAADEAIKPKMIETKWKWKQFIRPTSVREIVPAYEEVQRENPPLYSESVQTIEGASSQQMPENFLAENAVNQDERTGQLIQQLVDLPAPPTGFSNEDINETESEEDIPILVLE